MAKYTSLLSLPMLIIFHTFHQFPGVESTSFTITNNCNFTVWPLVADSTRSTATNSYGFSLESGDSKMIMLSVIQSGLITGRTHCSNTTTGLFRCESGDSSMSPVTLIEFTLSNPSSSVSQDFYDISLMEGYNLPVAVVPQVGKTHGSSRCAATGCVFNSYDGCPDELRVVNKNKNIIGCKTPCQTDCRRDSGTLFFKKKCPRACTYGEDDGSTYTFNCPSGVSYTVTFCPSPSLSNLISQPFQATQSPGSPSPSPFLSPTQSPGSPSPSPSPFLSPTQSPGSPSPSPFLSPPSFLAPPSKSTNFDDTSSTSDSKRKRTFLAVGLATSGAISILLLYGVWACVRKKVVKTSSLEESEIKNAAMDSLQFDLRTIQIATGHFAADKKLGQGGFGEVYKGILENGQEIAVKRLSDNSRQGNTEFKTEVALVAKLRHKNLVKLLGFCVSSEEKILVYEFLSQSSLDKFLVDQNRKTSLDWKTRFKIILGVARGLLYLHEDSPLKVIHRDLKSSNILLDEDMNPKIADFGLAKLFGVDQTQGDTKRIVGTYGYMAPEYAITGHYSVKSDVYSFGIIILEMVSGQMNRFFGRLQLEEALLHRAWRLWNEGNSLDLVDTTLSNNYSKEEVTKCIQIGLLCIQEEAALRPRITSIINDLNGQAHSLPMPKPPNFFGTISNYENNEIQHNEIGVYSGTRTITNLYPRD